MVCFRLYTNKEPLYMKQLYPSLEAINFQYKSPLAAGLVKFFQNIIDYRDSIQSSVRERVKKTTIYARDKFYEDFPKIVKSTTGLNCMHVYTDIRDTGLFGWACCMHVGDKYNINASRIIDMYSGTGMAKYIEDALKYYNMKVTSMEDLTNIVQSLNRSTGIYKVDELYDGRKVGFDLLFPIIGSFLMQECFQQKNMPLTAEELAAIVIHEIGHMHSMLEHSLDACARLQTAITACDYFVKNAPPKEKAKMAKALAESSDPAVKKAIDDLLANQHDSLGAHIVDGVTVIFELLMSAATIAFLPLWIANMLFTYAGDATTLICLNSNKRDKIADNRVSVHNFKLCERLADQFVVRHGLGHAQISALNKMDYNCAHGAGTNAFCVKSSGVWTATLLRYYVSVLTSGDIMHFESHDPTHSRSEIIIQETLEVFKQKLPPDMLDFYVKEYEESVKALEDRARSVRIADGIETFNRAVRYIIETPAALILSGRFNKEYEALVYKIRQLTANKLYYRAAKLEQLLNQKG